MEGDSLVQIAEEVRTCTRCDLCRTRTNSVPGAGNPNASVMFIGEGPGFNEDQQGLPFVGQAGKYLNELLGIAGLSRDDVFITNVVKCRPPSNRDPLPDEIAACSGYLERQMKLIDPELVVTLGRFSMNRWFPADKISRIHGQERSFDDRMVMPMYHPAAALRTGTVKVALESDFSRVPDVVAAAEKKRAKANTPPPPVAEELDQLPLF